MSYAVVLLLLLTVTTFTTETEAEGDNLLLHKLIKRSPNFGLSQIERDHRHNNRYDDRYGGRDRPDPDCRCPFPTRRPGSEEAGNNPQWDRAYEIHPCCN